MENGFLDARCQRDGKSAFECHIDMYVQHITGNKKQVRMRKLAEDGILD